jgi:hypothetical protein
MVAPADRPGGPEGYLYEARHRPDVAVGSPIFDLLCWGILLLGAMLP